MLFPFLFFYLPNSSAGKNVISLGAIMKIAIPITPEKTKGIIDLQISFVLIP